MGDVIRLPIPTPSCDDCDHASFSSHGIFCLMFREEIWRSTVAEECDEFLPIPTRRVTILNHERERQT